MNATTQTKEDLFKKTKYTRENPSARYRELLQQYQQLHTDGEKTLGLAPEDTFPGQSLPAQAPMIKRLIDATNAKSILDYGSGKGKQYHPRAIRIEGDLTQYASIQEYWGVEEITCYDPCYAPFNQLPETQFDGVVSTDVLEHCPEEDVEWIIDGLFAFSKKFVFGNIACYPAKKHLPNGENAHCTIKPGQWWVEYIQQAANRHPGRVFEFLLDVQVETENGPAIQRQRIANFD